MVSKDEILIGGGLLAGLALIMWYGDKLVKDGSKSLAENLKLPFSGGVNVTMPNIAVGMPSINLGLSGLGDLLNSKEVKAAEKGAVNTVPGLAAIWDYIMNHQTQTQTQTKATTTYNGPLQSNQERAKAIQDGSFFSGGIFTSSPVGALNPTSKNQVSTSGGGNGIWVTDPKVQGGGYYVQDNSQYGWSGLPASSAPIVPSASSSGSGSLASKSYHTKGYDGTVGGYRDYLNTIFSGQGDAWYGKVQSNPSGYGVV